MTPDTSNIIDCILSFDVSQLGHSLRLDFKDDASQTSRMQIKGSTAGAYLLKKGEQVRIAICALIPDGTWNVSLECVTAYGTPRYPNLEVTEWPPGWDVPLEPSPFAIDGSGGHDGSITWSGDSFKPAPGPYGEGIVFTTTMQPVHVTMTHGIWDFSLRLTTQITHSGKTFYRVFRHDPEVQVGDGTSDGVA